MPASWVWLLADGGGKMDPIDWGVFVVACVAIPISIWANIRWWRKVRKSELPRDWQSFWLILIGLVCMIAVICWYVIRFIIPGKY